MEILETSRLLDAQTPVPMLIGGRWVPSVENKTRVVENPATSAVIGSISYGSAQDAILAADAASMAFNHWSTTTSRYRADLLLSAANLLLSRAEPIARLLSAETGKRPSEALGEVRFSAEYFRWFAEEIRRPQGAMLTFEDPKRRAYTMERPAGVAICLTPWNFPLSIQARKVAPALAAGCTVVARPSEKAPLAVAELFRMLVDVGIPAGVVNLIYGPAEEQSTALIEHRSTRVLSFTGSTSVGSSLMRKAADRVVRCSLELGGDAPFIIFDDADIDRAIDGLLLAKFRNNGQSCIGANRVYVQRGIFDKVAERLGAILGAFVVGDPLAQSEPDLGPLIDAARVKEVGDLVDSAIASGAEWLGPKPEMPDGLCYSRPGFIVGAPIDAGLSATEVFGPVSAMHAFETEEEVIALANRSDMGLAGYAYTRSASRCWRLSDQLDVGILGLNHALPSVAFAPMGGTKASGLGREGARLGLEEYLETRYVSIGIDEG